MVQYFSNCICDLYRCVGCDVTGTYVFIMNIATETAAFLIVLIMGIFMITTKLKKPPIYIDGFFWWTITDSNR